MKIIRPQIDDDHVTIWWTSDPGMPGPCTMVRRHNKNHVWELRTWPGMDCGPSKTLNRRAAILKELRGMGVALMRHTPVGLDGAPLID